MTLPIGTEVTYQGERQVIIGYTDNIGAIWYKIKPVGYTGYHYNVVSGKYFYDIVEPPSDPCKGVVCNPVCVGVDLYATVCKDGKCVRGALMEANSTTCGYVKPECTESEKKPGYICSEGKWVPYTPKETHEMIEQPLPNTIEFQELIPGIKPPRVPILIPGMENLPLLPGWIIRDPEGNVINAGIRIPVLTWDIVQTPEEPPVEPVVPTTPPVEGDSCEIEGLQYGKLRCLRGKWRAAVGVLEEGAIEEEQMEL